MSERPSPARRCFGCGPDNPRGLAMHFRIEDDGRAVSEVEPEEYLQGYPGFVHGGGVATMLDEAMSWAAYGQGIWAMTARITMRFRESVPLQGRLSVAGWLTRDRGRFLEAKAELRDAHGKLLAEADGLFVRLDGERAEQVRRFSEAQTSD